MNKDEARMRLKIIENEAKKLQEMTAGPEILGHGDFGIDTIYHEPLLIVKQQNLTWPVAAFNENSVPCGAIINGEHTTRDVIKLGNIYRIMSNHEKLDSNLLATGLTIKDDSIKIYACRGIHCTKEKDAVQYNIKSAEKYCFALMNLIFELKQQPYRSIK